MFMYAVQTTVDLFDSQKTLSVILGNGPNLVAYLENDHIGIHIILRVVVHTIRGWVEIESSGDGASAEDEFW